MCNLEGVPEEITKRVYKIAEKALNGKSQKEQERWWAKAENVLGPLKTLTGISTHEMQAELDVFLDKTANSVFKQKHGKESLHHTVVEAVSTANKDLLVKNGFDERVSSCLCEVLRRGAQEIGITTDLGVYHEQALKLGRSTLINRLVREQNRVWFASRSNLNAKTLLDILEGVELVDLPSSIYKKISTAEEQLIKEQLRAAGKKRGV